VSWSALRILPSDQEKSRDAIVAALFASGAQAVVEDGLEIVTHFPGSTDLESVRSAVRSADVRAALSVAPVADEDWSVAWRSHVGVHKAGSLIVAPPWLAAPLDPAHTIVIDPGMAFGTGDHASTRGVLRLLPNVLRSGDIVADLGAGSAVLSIAAAKLGARRVYAIEMDPDAISNAEGNVRANGVAECVHVIEGDASALLPVVAPVQVVLANIISSGLGVLLAPIVTSLAPGGRAILSGLLASERDTFSELLTARSCRILDEVIEDDWWTVAIAKT
jgi:ribosomal protein L11 methyltransferase